MKRLIVLLFIGLFISFNAYPAEIDTLKVHSKILNKEVDVLVISPKNINNQTFPIIYLLHGYNGNAFSWLNIEPNLPKFSELYKITIVCPDNGNSWYWDSPNIETSKHESFMIKELYPYISKVFQNGINRNKVAITGLSMGGHGAFWLAGRHPSLFGAIGSMSGGLDLRSFSNSWNLKEHLGNVKESEMVWNEYTVISHIDRLVEHRYAIIFDCGIDDFFYPMNVDMHHKLLENKIPHDFISRPGAHNSEYWRNALAYQLLFFSNFFQESRP